MMADTKISALTSATTPLAGTEVLPIVQSGATVKVSVANLTAGRNIAAADIYASGNIAVGTLSGTQKLEVGANGVFRLQTGSTTMDCTPTPGGIDGFVWNVSSGYYDWNIAGALKVRLTSTSKFLIGTATDSGSKLVVAGDLGASVGNGASSIRMTNTATGNYASISAGLPGVSNDGMDFSTDGTRRMSISGAGIVTMPAYGAGAATFSAAGVISSVSDETWKTKDGVPANPDEMLQKLEPGYWFYNEEKAPVFGAERQLGFYAQNVNAAIGKEAAPIPEAGKPWGYYDRSVLAVTVMSLKNALNAIKEQQAIITDLTTRLSALEAK